MRYVDGYVLPILKRNLKAYTAMARMGRRMWLEQGALDYKECVGDDLAPSFGLPFPKAFKLKAGETIVFAYVVFKSRAHRDRVNARVMKAMSATPMLKKMPFDPKRMVYGGFRALVGG